MDLDLDSLKNEKNKTRGFLNFDRIFVCFFWTNQNEHFIEVKGFLEIGGTCRQNHQNSSKFFLIVLLQFTIDYQHNDSKDGTERKGRTVTKSQKFDELPNSEDFRLSPATSQESPRPLKGPQRRSLLDELLLRVVDREFGFFQHRLRAWSEEKERWKLCLATRRKGTTQREFILSF